MPIRARWVLTHFLLVTPLVPLSYLLYRDATVAIPFAVLVSLWTIFAAAAALAAFAAMAPLSIWTNAGRSLGIVWLYSICTALLGASAIQLIQRLWVPAADLTFGLVRRVLAPMLPNLQADTSLLILSTDRFAVLVSEECSGLEGMGLMITFCCAWLVYFRRDYIFPRALLLIPVGLVTIYTLNIVRIAALMLIGHNGFPGVAVYGFHSQAGWIAFNAAACGLVFVSRRNAWLNRQTVRSTATVETENPTAVYVMPLLAVLIAGTVSHALASDFERFYPLRMLAGAAVLIYHRKKLLTIDWQWSWRGPVVGLLIFVLWIVTARYVLPPAAVPSKLAVMSAAPRYLWIACRTTTAVLIVPLVEELAYRGFFDAATDQQGFRIGGVSFGQLACAVCRRDRLRVAARGYVVAGDRSGNCLRIAAHASGASGRGGRRACHQQSFDCVLRAGLEPVAAVVGLQVVILVDIFRKYFCRSVGNRRHTC
jgi:exosortase E/protease (VPEID-CTERM system)